MDPIFVVDTGDMREVLRDLEPNSVDAVPCDPPYGLSFMGRAWDHAVPGPDYWEAVYRVAKPGAYVAAFGGTRTYHRLACAIEDAGWELRDTLMWMYGQGFPKSMDVSKAIEAAVLTGGSSPKHLADAVDATGQGAPADGHRGMKWNEDDGTRQGVPRHAPGAWSPTTPEAKLWEGWGTALKPAWEPIILARKPLEGSTVEANVRKWGTGALNIGACRIGDKVRINAPAGNKPGGASYAMSVHGMPSNAQGKGAAGRWPANVILDEEAGAALDEQTGVLTSGKATKTYEATEEHSVALGKKRRALNPGSVFADSGGASRFFYCAKASRSEREAGLDGFEATIVNDGRESAVDNPYLRGDTKRRNTHPTVKPVELMRWIIRLITPPGGVVLDPFAGSGTTGIAAVLEGRPFYGIDLDPAYARLAEARIAHHARKAAG